MPRCSASSRVYNANHAIILFLRIHCNYKSPQGPQRLQFVYLINPCRGTFPGLSALLGARISPILQQTPDLSSRSRECISPEKGQLVSCFRFEEPPSVQLVKNLLKLLKCHLPWHVLNSRHISPSPHPFGPQTLAETSLKLKVSKNYLLPRTPDSQGKLPTTPSSTVLRTCGVHRMLGEVPGVPRGTSANGHLMESTGQCGNRYCHLAAQPNTPGLVLKGFPTDTDYITFTSLHLRM